MPATAQKSSRAETPDSKLLDRNGEPFSEGSLVVVQWCHGIHGQTARRRAHFVDADKYGGLRFRLAAGERSFVLRGDTRRGISSRLVEPGDVWYTCTVGTSTDEEGRSVHYQERGRIFHKHTTFVEVVSED